MPNPLYKENYSEKITQYMCKLANFQYIGKTFLGEFKCVISNRLSRSFLVQILSQKDDTDDNIFENKIYIKETKEKLIRKGKPSHICCNLWYLSE